VSRRARACVEARAQPQVVLGACRYCKSPSLLLVLHQVCSLLLSMLKLKDRMYLLVSNPRDAHVLLLLSPPPLLLPLPIHGMHRPEDFGEELAGIVRATGIDPSIIFIYNIFYTVFGACTSIVAQDSEGSIYHARNLDFGIW